MRAAAWQAPKLARRHRVDRVHSGNSHPCGRAALYQARSSSSRWRRKHHVAGRRPCPVRSGSPCACRRCRIHTFSATTCSTRTRLIGHTMPPCIRAPAPHRENVRLLQGSGRPAACVARGRSGTGSTRRHAQRSEKRPAASRRFGRGLERPHHLPPDEAHSGARLRNLRCRASGQGRKRSS